MTIEARSVSTLPSIGRKPAAIAILGGVGYGIVGLTWLFATAGDTTAESTASLLVGTGYAGGVLFVLSAVPLYLLVRFSLLAPVATAGLLMGNTVYEHLYGTHLHPLSSFFIVWPLLLGMALTAGIIEALCRSLLDRVLGRFGLRALC